MKLLFLARSRESRLLSELVGADSRHGLTVCSRAAEVVAAVDNAEEHFDWIILEGGANTESTEVARKIRTLGHGAPIAFISFADEEAEYHGNREQTLVCAVERSPQGSRVLSCTLSEAESGRQSEARALAKILFEYQAPCKKAGRGAA